MRPQFSRPSGGTQPLGLKQSVSDLPLAFAREWCGDRFARNPEEAELKLKDDCALLCEIGPGGLAGLLIAVMATVPSEAAKIRRLVRKCADVDPGLARKLRQIRLAEGASA